LQSDWALPLRWDSAVPLRERRQEMSPSTRAMWEFRKRMCSSIQFYHDLLRQGRSLVIANVDAEEQAATARSVFKQQGSESEDVDRARKELGKAA
jgi:hypothetical protein